MCHTDACGDANADMYAHTNCHAGTDTDASADADNNPHA